MNLVNELNSDQFLRRNMAIHKDVKNNETLGQNAIDLAQQIANLINNHKASYYEINQAIIIVDNGFYEKSLKTELGCSIFGKDL